MKQTQDLNPVGANTQGPCDGHLFFKGGQIPVVDEGILNLVLPGVTCLNAGLYVKSVLQGA